MPASEDTACQYNNKKFTMHVAGGGQIGLVLFGQRICCTKRRSRLGAVSYFLQGAGVGRTSGEAARNEGVNPRGKKKETEGSFTPKESAVRIFSPVPFWPKAFSVPNACTISENSTDLKKKDGLLAV